MKQRSILSLGLSLISLFCLTGSVSAQSSLIYTEAASGRRVEFTPFGTLVFQPQNLVSGGWRINYEDRAGSHSVWFINRQFSSGVVPVSLTANFPSGQTLATGTRLYVRAVMRTADGKLQVTQRFIWDAGRSPISSVLTVENTANSPLNVNNVIGWRPADPPTLPAERCPYIPPFEDSTAATTLVLFLGQRYLRTVVTFTATPLQPSQSRDVPTPGCHGGVDEPAPGSSGIG